MGQRCELRSSSCQWSNFQCKCQRKFGPLACPSRRIQQFGVVTRFDMKTFKQGQLWGGTIFYNMSTISEQLKALFDVNSQDNDRDAALIMNFGYGQGQFAVFNYFQYAKPIDDPSVFQPLVDIQPHQI